MVGEYLMFFQNNTRSKFSITKKFNQATVQWHNSNIGYSSVQALHSRLASCDSTQGSSTGFLFTYHSAIPENVFQGILFQWNSWLWGTIFN